MSDYMQSRISLSPAVLSGGFQSQAALGVCLSLLTISVAQPSFAEQARAIDFTQAAQAATTPSQRQISYEIQDGKLAISKHQLVALDSTESKSESKPDALQVKKSLVLEVQQLRHENQALMQQVRRLSEQVAQLQQLNAKPKWQPERLESKNLQPQKLKNPKIQQHSELPQSPSTPALIDQSVQAPAPTVVPEHSVNAYPHHVVYIFKNQEGRQKLWDALEKNGENDRWQGANSDKSRYFIYVGAYSSLEAARTRAAQLLNILGTQPIVYTDSE